MKSLLLAIYPIFAQSLANSPKLCINCKFYKKDFFSGSEFGKCALFPTEKPADKYLVNGKINDPPMDYTYCSTARKNDRMCGVEGKYFVRNDKWPPAQAPFRPFSPLRGQTSVLCY